MNKLFGFARHGLQLGWHSRLGMRRPDMLLNSIPKAGTHLAVSYLRAAGLAYNGYHRTIRSEGIVLRDGPGRCFAVAHAFEGDLPPGGNRWLLYRDPVDVAISMSAYIMARPDHWWHATFRDLGLRDAVLTIVRGSEDLESLGERYARFAAWARRNGATTIAFQAMRDDPAAFVQRCTGGTWPVDGAALQRGAQRWNPTKRTRSLPLEAETKAEIRQLIETTERQLHDAYQELQSLH